jgi:hypothetical protein
MQWRDVTYRIYRLRRLVAVCIVVMIIGAAVGIWLAGGNGALAGPLPIVATLAFFGALHVAMALRWPNNPVGPLAYSIGVAVLLTAVIPLAAFVDANPEVFAPVIGASIVFGPFVWFLGAPLIGFLLLWPMDFVPLRNLVMRKALQIDMTAEAAFDHFSLRPDRETSQAKNGPVGWDGFWEEQSARLAPDPKSSRLVATPVVVRIKELESAPLSQSLLVLMPTPTPSGSVGTMRSIIIHLSAAPSDQGAVVSKITSIDRTNLGGLVMDWLADTSGDVLTCELDHLQGNPPRALYLLPVDSLGATVHRYFHTDGPHIV